MENKKTIQLGIIAVIALIGVVMFFMSWQDVEPGEEGFIYRPFGGGIDNIEITGDMNINSPVITEFYPDQFNLYCSCAINQEFYIIAEDPDTGSSQLSYNWYLNDELVSEGNKYWDEHKSAPDIYAMKMRSRANESTQLTNISTMGQYSVINFVINLPNGFLNS